MVVFGTTDGYINRVFVYDCVNMCLNGRSNPKIIKIIFVNYKDVLLSINYVFRRLNSVLDVPGVYIYNDTRVSVYFSISSFIDVV